MNIFLTGATGFLGSHVLRVCLERGHKVFASTRRDLSTLNLPFGQQVNWIQCSPHEVPPQLLGNCDTLIHLAAHSVLYPFDDLRNCIHHNLSLPLLLLENARDSGIRRYVVAGSCFEYGNTAELQSKTSTMAALAPTNSYAVSKAAATLAFCQWATEHNLSLDVLRVFHLFGEGEPPTRFWPSLRRAALSGDDYRMSSGEQIRDFMEVSRVAEVFVDRAEVSSTQSQSAHVYNLSSDNIISLKEFAEYWWKYWNATGQLILGAVPYRPNEVMRFVPGPDILAVESYISTI